MKRVILDTNIYGRVVENRDMRLVLDTADRLFKVYGSVVINRELRGYEGKVIIRFEGKDRRYRALLFEVYNLLVKDRIYPLDTEVERLAEGYFIAYTKFGGKASWKQMVHDFLIVATASIHGLEIVYSDDSRTMVSEEALKSYEVVNGVNHLAVPQFKSYQELKAELEKHAKRWSA